MTPRGESKEPTNPNSPRSIDRLSEYAGLLSDVSVLIAELDVNQVTDQSEVIDHIAAQSDRTFSFELIGDHQVVIPETIRAAMPDIDQITVTISKTGVEMPSMLSIDLLSDTRIITISRSGTDEGNDEPDVLIDTSFKARPGANLLKTAKQQMRSESTKDFEDRLIPIDKVSNAELNTLIMSLIYPNAERGYQMFADVNFLSPSAYESLTESFHLSALNNNNAMSYDFKSSNSHFSFMKQEGQPISFTLIYNEDKEDRLVTMQSNMETEFRLQFTTGYEMVRSSGYTTDERMPYYPTAEELQYLRSLLVTEITRLNPTPVAFLKDGRIDDLDAETILIERGTDVLSIGQRYIREVLKELGLDAPDSGTT
jgi:hypothetical protein